MEISGRIEFDIALIIKDGSSNVLNVYVLYIAYSVVIYDNGSPLYVSSLVNIIGSKKKLWWRKGLKKLLKQHDTTVRNE